MKRLLNILLFFYLALTLRAATYYVAPDGNDNAAGTIGAPWATWDKAFATATPGDVVYFRGGVYYMTNPGGVGYDRDVVGTASDSILFLNYPGEVPILDCGNITPAPGANHHALTLHLTYSRVRGLVIRNVNQTSPTVEVQAFTIVGYHSVVDQCIVNNTGGRGFWIVDSDELLLKNCDAYNNSDRLTSVLPGNDGYGYFIQDMTNTTRRVYLRQCRAWRCGDDGFTCYTNAFVEFDRCWSMYNGDMEGEGHGFKLGWLDLESAGLRRVVINCLAAWNKSDGINTNDEPGISAAAVMNIFNNTCYHNTTSSVGGDAYGYIIFNTGSIDARELGRVFRNNIAYENTAGDVLATAGGLYTHTYNNWDLSVTITDADFVSVDTTGLSSARSASGTLPNMNGFMQIAPGSDLIDAGADIGLPYNGSAPDLGYIEYVGTLSSANHITALSHASQTGPAIINATNHTVLLQVTNGTSLLSFSPTISVSPNATINPTSGTARDFSTSLIYTVIAQDGTAQNWTVTIIAASEPIVNPSIVRFGKVGGIFGKVSGKFTRN